MTTVSIPPARAASPPALRLPTGVLTLFAVPLGLVGLAGVWSEAGTVAGAPSWVADALYVLGGLFWVSYTVGYLVKNVRERGVLTGDLKNPAIAPLTAYIPVVGLLFVPRLARLSHTPAEWVCWVLVSILVVLVARLLANWFRGDVPLAAVHPGYFLPYVAGASIAGIALVSIGAHTEALTAVGAGLFFFVIIMALLLARLAAGEKLPPPAQPLLSVPLASPATAGIALFAANGNQLDPLIDALLGVIVLMLLVQVMLLPDYRRAGFTLGFWAFAFPIASTSNFTMRWLTAVHAENTDAWSWGVTSLATLGIGAIAARSVVLMWAKRTARPLPAAYPRR
jgi:tellurite resistance protein